MSAHRVWVAAATVVSTLGASLVLAGPAEAAVRCGGERATIVGTEKADYLLGTRGADVIVGRQGLDAIRGRGGRDVICGNHGADRLSGGPGPDRLLGGRDWVLPGANDLLSGDHLSGGAGDDRLFPGVDTRPADVRFRDELLWRNAPRRVRIDLARGVAVGWGRDTFPARTAIRVTATSFADQIDGSPRSDQIDAGRGSDQIHARAGDDQIQNARDRTAPAVGDRIFAGAGDDHIDYTFGPETGQVVSAGAGIDFATVHDNQVNPFGRRRPATGFFDMQTGQVTYQAGQQRVEFALQGFEGVFIGEEDSANRPLRALATWQVAGTEGNDRVNGGSTNGTTFDALAGDDTFTSSPGQDSYDGGSGDDLAINMGSRGETDACQNVERFETSTACSNTSP